MIARLPSHPVRAGLLDFSDTDQLFIDAAFITSNYDWTKVCFVYFRFSRGNVRKKTEFMLHRYQTPSVSGKG